MRILEIHKSKLYLLLFTLTAFVLAWGAWVNYRPHVILASCGDIAYKSSNLTKRYQVQGYGEENYDIIFNNCLNDAGFND